MFIDPTLIYLALLAGLWLAVAAIYLPGTGIVEALAAVVTILAVIALASMPTNWIAVIAVIVGVMGFLILPLLNQRFMLVAIAGLGLQTVGGLTLFDGVSVSWIVVLVTVAASIVYYRYVLTRSLAFQKANPAMIDDQPLVGAYGYVQKALNPVGTVYVRGESWTARAEEPIPTGTLVVVVEREELTLFVEPVKEKHREPAIEEA